MPLTTNLPTMQLMPPKRIPPLHSLTTPLHLPLVGHIAPRLAQSLRTDLASLVLPTQVHYITYHSQIILLPVLLLYDTLADRFEFAAQDVALDFQLVVLSVLTTTQILLVVVDPLRYFFQTVVVKPIEVEQFGRFYGLRLPLDQNGALPFLPEGHFFHEINLFLNSSDDFLLEIGRVGRF